MEPELERSQTRLREAERRMMKPFLSPEAGGKGTTEAENRMDIARKH